MRAYFLVAALALAGCQSADERRAAETGEVQITNASMNDVTRLTKAARPKTLMQPGEWRTALHVVAADLSAIPEGPARDRQMAAIKEQERNAQKCATADDLKPLNIDNLEQVTGASCTFPHYIQAGGKLDAEIHCGDGANRTVLVATGTLSQTRYDVTIQQTTGAKGAANYLGLTLRAEGERTGNCVAKPKN
ncbi:MAG: DUF3617 family protein [Sphingomonas sp.]|uniref:DUF3617 domain-containing protein n=1 Tax=Sphingomonas sp. TaxID=28214 RepID=UPI0025F75B53|nr:DUF3617 family protein [Sphingomonas sp.]MBX3565292.1 DUF3617 family protein [Sphingomonas sp.]